MKFTHLHLHTEYSLLDGAIKVKELMKKIPEFGMDSVAITDHGNLHGVLNFYKEANAAKIKPIIGCETYVAKRTLHQKEDIDKSGHHLILLAKNDIGYQNLVRMISTASIDGFYYKPRVDKNLLKKYSEGIIALSACLGGEIPQLLYQDKEDLARKAINEYIEIFGDNFNIEIQANGYPEQDLVNPKLVQIAKDFSIPIVATNDCHYLHKDDKRMHEVLLCIQTQKTIDDNTRMKSEGELYVKTPEEMYEYFKDLCPEAVGRSYEIAEMCNVKIKTAKETGYHFPIYNLEDGISLEDEFKKLSREGLENRFKEMEVDEKAYRLRLEEELDMICKMDFPGYFLIVQDFINWAKKNGIPVGPGRGSVAGSLVAYALNITNIDPIPYNLLFERFLNPERVSMPDIDVDFCQRRRGEVIAYMAEKYGKEKVAQITTYGGMKAKNALRDVGRAMGVPHSIMDKVAKLVPEDLKVKLKDAEENTDFMQAINTEHERLPEVLEIAKKLEGMIRHASIHAAGLVVADKDMTEYTPIYKGSDNEIVTQFDMKNVEQVGLVKFDFLGLITMTVIEDTLKHIKESGKNVPNLNTLKLNDPKVFKIFADGNTDGIFQMESSGMKGYLEKLKPTNFEDIIAMCALYRPGPLGSGMVDSFIKRKHGEEKIDYPLDNMASFLAPTYGVMCYQEQVMETARVVAGYTLGGADLLRRAMGKKIKEEMDAQRSVFVQGAMKNGVLEKKANEIFDLMEKFAEYGFNKSHSAAYALIAYHTAYLKCYYPSEFMSALLTSEINDTDKITKYVQVCKKMNINVLPPDFNESGINFTPVANNIIRYGLTAVKGIGEEIVKEIIKERTKNGKYKSLLDSISRNVGKKMGKGTLEPLIKAGAFDFLSVSRAGLLAVLPKVIDKANKDQKNSGQHSLFSLLGDKIGVDNGKIGFECSEEKIPEFALIEKLEHEKNAVGFYLSGHPLDGFDNIEGFTSSNMIKSLEVGEYIKTLVIITKIERKITRNGKPMHIISCEDKTGSFTSCIFERTMNKIDNIHLDAFEKKYPIVIEGKKSEFGRDGNNIDTIKMYDGKNIIQQVENNTLKKEKYVRKIEHRTKSEKEFVITFDIEEINKKILDEITHFAKNNIGNIPCHIVITNGETKIGASNYIIPLKLKVSNLFKDNIQDYIKKHKGEIL